jgi:4-amino-4-deoxy-L-arabinose transferase-like glycosyltransferase
VPLGSLEFLAVTVAAFLPWSLAAPWAVARAFRRPWTTAVDRMWLLLGVWALLVVGFFAVVPFKLPHHGLPAFPALALLVARLWDDALSAEPRAPRLGRLLAPVLVVLVAGAAAAALAFAGALPSLSPAGFGPLLGTAALVLAAGAAGLALAWRRRRHDLALAVAVAAVLAFLPLAGRGMAEFARSRSAAPVVEALLARLGPGDLVAHEGAIEHTASALLALRRPVHIVDGRGSNLAFGATIPDARDVFWDRARLGEAWGGSQRVFLVSAARPERSVLQGLPPGRVHLLRERGGRRLYSNLAD